MKIEPGDIIEYDGPDCPQFKYMDMFIVQAWSLGRWWLHKVDLMTVYHHPGKLLNIYNSKLHTTTISPTTCRLLFRKVHHFDGR